MSRLPIVNSKAFEKVLLHWDFNSFAKKEVMLFINIPMAGTLPFLTTAAILAAL
jgi:hypothetical protein